jgi:hypothetical protein
VTQKSLTKRLTNGLRCGIIEAKMEVNMIDISKAEKYFKNNGYDDIIEESKPFCAYYTSMNVWGNEIAWLDVSNPEKVTQKKV